MEVSADAAAAAAARTLRWAGRAGHLGGVPRAAVIGAVGTIAKAYVSLLNTTTVHNADALHRLVSSRPPGTPLLTVSNHMSTIDDPFMWGFKGFPITDSKLARCCAYGYKFWSLFGCKFLHGIFKQLHSFPEGKVAQDHQPIRRLKWGTASLIVRAPVTPIVLPIVHTGFEKVMPEKSFFGRRPPLPLCGKEIKIIVGEPVDFDLPGLKQVAAMIPQDTSFERKGWPTITPEGLDEAAQRWLYQKMSDKIQSAMESLRKTLLNLKQH
uniref:Tafazzin family protein n=1 Tax=Aegilops tauschii subsp. strangulata TaxID=200361 RepID=A0A453D3F4_AEGTS